MYLNPLNPNKHMNDRIHRHMVFNKDLKYNKISFKLQIKLLDLKVEKLNEVLKENNNEIIYSEGIFEKILELKTPKTMKKDSNNNREHNIKIKENYNSIKNEFYEFLNLIKILNLKVESVKYTEEYFIE
jgi:hypothetical protein